MRYISVCSGIEAASVAWQPLGWEAVAFAEIEPFPNAVLAYHFPNVPNLGDISKVDWRHYHGTIDLVVGGTPCQSFSVAGKREGLDGASGLVREYFRLLSEVHPRFFLWENVPGCLSSGNPKGSDFEFILRQWSDLGYHVAWRVLDAQYFGVAQRRRRVFAFGSLRDWRDPVKVLFEPEGLPRDTPPRRKARQENPGGSAGGAGKASHWNGGPHPTLSCSFSGCSNQELFKQGGAGLVPALVRMREGKPGGGKGPLVSEGISLTLGTSNDQALFIYPVDLRALSKVARGDPVIGSDDAPAYTLTKCETHGVAVCADVAPTVSASGPPYSRMGNDRVEADALVCMQTAVRRLTPIEVERLQGFPDCWTDIPFKGKPAPDGARYKALGNSMCVNVMRWIGERIDAVDKGI